MTDHAVIDILEDGLVRDDVSHWSPEQVAYWLEMNGYQEHKVAVLDTHNVIDGQRLLSLTRDDLQAPPFNMANIHEVDHLHSCIESLRKSQLTKYLEQHNGVRNGFALAGNRSHAKANGGIPNGYAHSGTRLENGGLHHHTDITTPLISAFLAQLPQPARDSRRYEQVYSRQCSEEKRLRSVLHARPLECSAASVDATQELVQACRFLRAWLDTLHMASSDAAEAVRQAVMNGLSGSTSTFQKEDSSGEDTITSGSGHAPKQPYPAEKLKTLVGLMYMMFGFVVSVVMLQVVHDRVPDMAEEPPLPDVFFDIVPRRVEGAFSICETIGMVLTFFIAALAVFHKHRFIIARRIFFILGTLYLYRSITIYVTTLPVPGLHFKCAPKSNGHISIMLSRAAGLLFGGGLTVTGSHHFCGDYLFSGHTIILTISSLTIQEYTPKRWWWLHWMSWFAAAIGVVCILLAHDHYTVDVVVAYLLTTRLFWTYHSMCNVAVLKEANDANMFSRAWWFPIFRYFECNVSANGALPRQYEWPLPWPRRFRNSVLPGRRSPVKGV